MAHEPRFHLVWMMDSAAERKVKGSYLIQVRALLEERLGAGSYERISSEDNGRVGGTLLPGAWYEVEPLLRILRVATRELGTDMEKLGAEISRRSAFADLTTIYRVFLRVPQAQHMLQSVPQMWRTYFNFAEGHAIQNDHGHFVGQCDHLPRDLLPWVCGSWLGFIPAALELCRARASSAKIMRTWRDPDDTYSLQVDVTYRPQTGS